MSHETAPNYVYYCCCTQTPPLYKTTEYASSGNYSTSGTCTVVRAKPVYTEATTATKTGFCLEARAMAAVWNRERRRQRRARSASAHERGGGARSRGSAEARGADLGARTSEREARSGHWRGGRCAISPPLTGERGGTTRARSASGSLARRLASAERERTRARSAILPPRARSASAHWRGGGGVALTSGEQLWLYH